ncbi:MAG: ATP-binding protein [Pseudomonadota bacterium]|nr:ATP-binding protein [Pseudomonadota bacterium]
MNTHTRVFESAVAVREKVPLLLGLMGPSGSGKTYSALRLATGIQSVSGGEIFVIDTEAKRAKHYADKFKFQHTPFGAPFSPTDYLAAIQHCMAKGAGVIVVDSMSHEHEGQGGVLEMHEAELDRMTGKDGEAWKRNANNFPAWAKPKAERRKLISALLQMNCNFIFCFRAKEKAKPVKKDGKSSLENQGWMPIAGEEFIFEQTANMLLLPSSNGVPTWRSEYPGERSMMKLPEQFRGILDREDAQLTEDIGAQLAEWAKGAPPRIANPATLELARTAARGGTDVFEVWWKTASKDERADAKTIKDELASLRTDADAEQAAKEDMP